MIRKIIMLLTMAAVLFCVPVVSAQPGVSAESAVLLEQSSGKVVFEKNANEKLPIASTTKIMTALLTVESGDLSRTLVTTKEMVTVEGSSMGLRAGDTVSLEALVYGMLLASGNDAANTAAIYLAGSLEKFSKMMNQKAKEIGMKNSHFVTPSGLDADDHYSTAYDMALLAAYAMKNPVFAKAAGCRQKSVTYGNPPYKRTLTNHNRLLNSYKGSTGVKTGFTKKSGRCLVSSATRDGVSLIAVTLDAPSDWNDHEQMLDYGFSCYESYELPTGIADMTLPVTGGLASEIRLTAQSPVLVCTPEEYSKIERAYLLPRFCYAPVKKGDTLGQLVFYRENTEVARVDITAEESVEKCAVSDDYFSERLFYWLRLLLSY